MSIIDESMHSLRPWKKNVGVLSKGKVDNKKAGQSVQSGKL